MPAESPGRVPQEASPSSATSAAKRPATSASTPPAAAQPPPENPTATRLGLRFVRIPAGSIAVAAADGGPPRRATVPRPIEMQTTEVTQAQWQAVMGTNPSGFRGGSLPVENVSLAEVQAFLQKLNALDPGRRYRLPTAAEWEYACRAGRSGGPAADPGAVSWHDGNAGNRTHPVRQKKANALGLHDMLGNVWELCEDVPPRPPSGTAAPAEAPPPGPEVSLRGGSWGYEAGNAAPANRPGNQAGLRGNDIGFRLVRDPAPARTAARGPQGKR